MVERYKLGMLLDVILADDPGMGKTVTTLLALEQLAYLREQEYKASESGATADESGEVTERNYRPTLILVPSSLVLDRWEADAESYFGPDLTLRVWYSTEASSSSNLFRGRRFIKSSLRALRDELDRWSPNDPRSARVCIITTYSTFKRRALYITAVKPSGSEDEMADEIDDGQAGGDSDNDSQCSSTLGADDVIDQDAATDKDYRDIQRDKANATKYEYINQVAGRFSMAICDEAHYLKNSGTLVHKSVESAQLHSRWFVTATPMLNKVLDLHGFLSLIWRPQWELQLDDRVEEEGVIYSDDFDPTPFFDTDDNVDNIHSLWYAYKQGLRLYVLNPKVFLRQSANGHFSAAIARTILPCILKLLQLRRTMATRIDLGDGVAIRPGETIPHYCIKTVELDFDPEQLNKYNSIYDKLRFRLHGGGQGAAGRQGTEGPTEVGRISMATHRRLCHATFNLGLETMFENTRHGFRAADIDKWVHRDKDRGMTRYFDKTRHGPEYQTPRDRVTFGHYLTYWSPKLQYVCKYIAEKCLEKNERVLIFCQWPATLYMVDGVLTSYGIKVSRG